MSASPVAILLSTWNGAAYLSDQLASFLRLNGPDWRLYWRDDRGIARGMRDLAGEIGIGRAQAGMQIGRDRPGRIGLEARGVEALDGVAAGTPALYCARQSLVNAALRPIRLSARVTDPPGFPQALTQNIATGCTVMLNADAAGLVAEACAPAETLHDWWAYVLVSASGGEVLADQAPTVLYRQHARNAVGVPLSPVLRSWAALRRGPHVFMRTFRAHMGALESQAHLLSPAAREALGLITAGLHDGWQKRLRALGHPGLRRQNWAETQLFRLWFLLG